MSTNPSQPKKRRTGTIIGAIGIFLLGGCTGGLIGSAGSDGTPAPTETVTVTPEAPQTEPETVPAPEPASEAPDPSQGVPVVLEITSNVPVEVDWMDADTSNSEPAPVNGTWTKDLTTDPEGFNFFSVSAFEPNGNANAVVSCRILVDGQEVEANEAIGEYASANCSSS